MSQYKDKSLDDLYQQINATRERLNEADEHIKSLGEGAQKIGMSITGATLEINTLMKQLFLCAQHDLQEYEILHRTLMEHLQNITIIVNTKFGKLKEMEGTPENELLN